MPKVYKRAVARRDLIDHYVYLAGEGCEKLADQFLLQAEQSFTDLLQQPEIGAPLTVRGADLVSVRKWRVKGFENFLFFYSPRPGGVSIVRVLHAAQDWWSRLGIV